MQTSPREQGFTLLELLVALTISLFIGIGAHAMLASVMNAERGTKERSRQLARLEKAMWLISEDLTQIRRDTLAMPSGGFAASFVRRGWSNPAGLPRGDLLHVAYGFSDHTLKRYYSPVDQAGAPVAQELLGDVSDFRMQMLGTLAVEITLTLEPYGSLRRVIELPEL